MQDFFKKAKDWFMIIVFVSGCVYVVQDYGDYKIMAQDAEEINKGQYKLITQNARRLDKMDTELKLMFKLGAISKETFDDLRMMPKEPVDAEGNVNKEWYLIGEEDIYIIKLPDSCDANVVKMPIE